MQATIAFDGASAAVQEAAAGDVGLRPNQLDALRVLGYAYLQNARFDKALILFEALRDALPGDAQVRVSLAYTQVRLGRFDAALALISAAPASGATPPPVFHLLRAKALSGLGRIDDARLELLAFTRNGGAR